ncbi:hypothetical protein DFS34DRAFT_436911 [Phlyctochytrium arcticum]|nr:hypothetical protein DFS34DRAFT_436911 [Phlyctochytrium arcticum]
MDELYMEAKDENIKLRQAEVEFRNAFAGGAKREEHARNLSKVARLETENLELQQELTRHKGLADIASAQASDIVHHQVIDEKEKAILRAAVEELQMEGDEKLVIGKLHHHILTLQMSELMALRNAEKYQERCLTLEHKTIELENRVDERDEIIFHLRLDHKVRSRELQSNISELRGKLIGSVLLDKHERTCERVRILDACKTQAERSLQKHTDEKKRLLLQLDEAKLHLKSQEELLTAMKEKSTSANRLAQWHSKMSEIQLADLRVRRELAHEQEAARSAQSELDQANTRLLVLEEDYVKLQTLSDKRQIEWEKRVDELEQSVQAYEDERDRIFQAASAMDIKEAIPDHGMPVGQQLEASLRLLVERGRLVTAQEIKISTLEGKLRTLESHLQDNVDELYKSKSNLTHLQLELTQRDISHRNDAAEAASAKAHVQVIDKSREREGAAIRVAKEAIASLQRQLVAKDELIEKYRVMLKETRDEMQRHNQEYVVALQERTDMMNAMGDRQVDRVSRPHEHSQSSSLRENEDKNEIEKLGKIIEAKEQEFAGLQQRMRIVMEKAEQEKSKAAKDVQNLETELRQKIQNIESCKQELQDISYKLEEAELKASESEYDRLTAENSHLRDTLMKKESLIAKHSKTISDLKAVITQKEEEFRKFSERHNPADIDNLVKHRTGVLEMKLRHQKKITEQYQSLEFPPGSKLTPEQEALTKLHQEGREALLHHQKRLDRLVDENNSLRKQVASMKKRGGHPVAPTPPPALPPPAVKVATKSEIETEKWEIEKRYQKRLEVLKEKLAKSTSELENMTRLFNLGKESLARAERERWRLHARVNHLSAQMKSNSQGSGQPAQQIPTELTTYEMDVEKAGVERAHTEEMEKLRAHISSLEISVQELKRAKLAPSQELFQAREANRLLQQRLTTLEELNEQMSAGRDVYNSASESQDVRSALRPGEKTANLVSVLESRIRDFVNKYEALESDKLKVENDLLEAKFELGDATDSVARLERRVRELEEYKSKITSLEEKRRLPDPESQIPGLSISLSQLRSTTSLLKGRSIPELMGVVENVARMADKLKTENELLKKTGTSQSKHMEALREVKRLKKELADLAADKKEVNEGQRKISRVEEENTKLRRDLRLEREKLTKVETQMAELKAAKEKLTTDMANLRKTFTRLNETDQSHQPSPKPETKDNTQIDSTVQLKLEDLKSQVAERDAIIKDLTSGVAGDDGRLSAENRRLTRELEMWRIKSTNLTSQIAAGTGKRTLSGSSAVPVFDPRKYEDGDLATIRERLVELENENERLLGGFSLSIYIWQLKF